MIKIKNKILSVFDKNKANHINILFTVFLLSFLLDRILNYFFYAPTYVSLLLVILPFLFVLSHFRLHDKKQLYILIFSFLIIAIINNLIYGFNKRNISDVLFIFQFIISYYLYKTNIHGIVIKYIYYFLGVCIFLFIFTFIGIDSTLQNKKPITNKIVNIEPVLSNNADSIQNNGILKFESNPLNKLEFVRIYHNGIFRLAHVASYFYGFLFLFFAFQYNRTKKIWNILLLTLCFGFSIYTGSRTIISAFSLSLLLYIFRKKHIVYTVLSIIVLAIIVLKIDLFLSLTEDTFIFQYFSLIKTSTQNFTRLSRYMIFYSWWTEVKEFGVLELITGKSFNNALSANFQNLGRNIWFHNDFLNIFYSYGILPTLLYIWFFIKIYRDNRIWINRNIFISIFYSSMVITALLNGFYYYFPVLLLYIFFLMIKDEKQTVT